MPLHSNRRGNLLTSQLLHLLSAWYGERNSARWVLGTVYETRGSSYRKAGAMMLFGDQGSPFITILAVDPHVIIKGIEQNIHGHGLFHDSSINGHDYLRNIVHLPFFLQTQVCGRNIPWMYDF